MSMSPTLVSIAMVGALTAAVIGRQNTSAPLPVVGRSKVATKYSIVAARQPLAARASRPWAPSL